MRRAPAVAGGASDRIGRALASMRKAFNEGAATTGPRAGMRGGAAGDIRGKRLSERKQRALRVGSDMLEGLDGEEEDEDDDDEGDEELETDLDDDEDDEDPDDDAGYADEDYDPIAPRGPLENNNYGEVWLPIQARPRRNRKDRAMRRLVQESLVKPSSLIYPLFVHDEERSEPIASLPGHRRLCPADVLKEVEEARRYGVNAFLLFPKVDDDLKSPLGEESSNPDGLMPRIIMAIKDAYPDALVLADVALDPYSTSGHDGVVDEETGAVLNDMTVYQICKQSVNLARAGADMVCPSEMMDGRVTAIREALDMEGCVETSILSYACKYASSLYGPFRDAVGSNAKGGVDKKTYQMDISNAMEAEREAELDVQEGADMLMVKPGTPYLDVLRRVRQKTNVPLAAYQVSGEYAMIKAAAEKGWIDEKAVVLETLKGFRRAGADAIATEMKLPGPPGDEGYRVAQAPFGCCASAENARGAVRRRQPEMAYDSAKATFLSPPTAPRGSPLPPPGGGGYSFEVGSGLQLLDSGDRSVSRLFSSNVFENALEGEDHRETQGPLSAIKNSTTPHLLSTLLPQHPYLQRRLLASGLEVFVLPHAHPEGSLEVHLEVHAGSTAEGESERGMAHLCEHLVFMGNRRRGEVVALQGEANAFTDFHHTVYFVSWRGGEGKGRESQKARRGQEQQDAGLEDGSPRRLRAALEMMQEVFTAPTQFTTERLLKEKAAVLSESSLVNTIFYRKEQAQLSKLHSDTILPSRFPIGDMGLLRDWSVEEVRKYFARFYRPENATLYIVGDVAPLAALRYVDDILGPVRGDKGGEEEWRVVRDRWLERTVKKQSVFFPPLAHAWTKEDKATDAVMRQTATNTVKAEARGAVVEGTDSAANSLEILLEPRLHVWQHSLLQHFSVLFLRKLPIVALRTAGEFFRLLARKLALQALAVRLTERCRREDDTWIRVEVADTESVKEGCRIVSVEAEGEQRCWRDAVRVAVEEVRQMAEHGLSEAELASLIDSYKVNLDRMHMQLLSSGDMLRLLMDSTACGHRVMHLEDERGLARQLARGELGFLSRAGDAVARDGTEAAGSEMKQLLALVNEEARSMLKWMHGPINRKELHSGPDAICAFLVQSGGPASTGSSFPAQGKRFPSTQLQGHIEMELSETGTVSVEGTTPPGIPYGHPDDGTSQTTFAIPEESILREVCEAMTRPVPSKREGVETPKNLLTNEELKALRSRAAGSPPVTQRLNEAGPNAQMLQKVTIKPLAEERGSALIRGRLGPNLDSAKTSTDRKELEILRLQSAAMVVGAMTMMEGGAVGPFTRQQIEAFCQERLIGVSIECLDEFLAIDISAPAFATRDADSDRAGNLARTSTLESAMQLLHLIFTAFHFEESAFRRAKQRVLMDYHAYTRDLVGYSLGELILNMTGRDPRFDSLKPAVTASLELPFVEQQMRSHIKQQLGRGLVEITVVGDVDSAHVARLAATYLGTIGQAAMNGGQPKEHLPVSPAQLSLQSPYYHLQEASTCTLAQEWIPSPDTGEGLSAGHWTKVWGRRLHAYVRDSEARAVVHIGGFACNRWGRNPNGMWVWDQMEAVQRRDDPIADGMDGRIIERKPHWTANEHRKHPAFPRVALWILQELVTKRLFSILREEKRLTYEAAFDVMSFDILWGGIFIVTVHTQPEEAERVVEATHMALQQLTSIRPLLQSQLDGARQQVLSRHLHDRKYARYWLDLLGGLQLADVPRKTPAYFADFEQVVKSITLQDVHLFLRSLGLRRESMWVAIGVSGPVSPAALSRPPNGIVDSPAASPSSTRLRASGSARAPLACA
ncbi:M16 family peptidase, putative [Eimeria brunetti]|uniref:Delta-aminolevulinic acid dehydratase n=1 Tax=Eimeria brunetti TaxID=51314 RepID=U6L9R8_9EIME|nr:M16 family peptidase, putative [Eimeria brunetti]